MVSAEVDLPEGVDPEIVAAVSGADGAYANDG